MHLYSIILTLTVSALGVFLVAYIRKKAENTALLEDNRRLVQETEKIRLDFSVQLEEIKNKHQLEFTRKKYRYEAKLQAFKEFFAFLDSLGKESNEELKSVFLPALIEFHEETLSAAQIGDSLGYTEATQRFFGIIMASTAKYGSINSTLKNQTNNIKLHCSDVLAEKIERLANLYHQEITNAIDLMKQMNTLENIQNPERLNSLIAGTPNNANTIQETQQDVMRLFRHELNEI